MLQSSNIGSQVQRFGEKKAFGVGFWVNGLRIQVEGLRFRLKV
jgi:hypothetical protein